MPDYLCPEDVPEDVRRAWQLWQGVPVLFVKLEEGGFEWSYSHSWAKQNRDQFEAFWRFQDGSDSRISKALYGDALTLAVMELWAEIEDIAAKTYAGLSSDVVEKLDKIDLTSFTTPQVSTRTMTFAFVDSEAERLNAVLDDLDGLPAKEIWLADVGQFDRFFDLLEATKRTFDVRNASLAMLKLMDLAEEAIANHKPEQATEGAA